jgi:outer membrane protein assembly factor BamB
MAVVGGRVFTQVRRSLNNAQREFCVCLDAVTGDELWATEVDVADYTDLSGYPNAMDGPRSTPTVQSDRVYVLTSHLRLLSLRANDGTVVWTRDFPAELNSSLIPWESAASPLIVGDLIYLNANATGRRLTAIRATDGTTAWAGEDDVMTHATPVYGRIFDTDQVIFLTHSGLVAVAPDGGKVLWRLGFTPSSTSTAASPAIVGDAVWASAAYASGTWVASVSRQGTNFTASELWHQQGTAYQSHWSTPVTHEGFLYAVPSPSSPQGRLACFDPATGLNRWTQTTVGSGNIGFGSLIKAGGLLVVLTESGELVLVNPDPDRYAEVAKFQVLAQYCWNHVALSNGRIYARSTSLSPEIVAVDVAPPVAALPALKLAAEISDGSESLTLIIRAADATDLNSGGTGSVELLSSTNLFAPSSQWSVVGAALLATNGTWITDLPLGNEPGRFLRMRAKNGTN